MDTQFLVHYHEARNIAQTNTCLRLLACSFTDGLFHNKDFTCEVRDLISDERTMLTDCEEALDYLYTRDQQRPIEITLHHGNDHLIVRDPCAVWQFLKGFVQSNVGDAFDESKWHTAQYSMLCSLNSEALSIAHQLAFKAQCQPGIAEKHTAWEWLVAQKDAGVDIDALLLQVSSFGGNPSHPFSKLRRKIHDNQELSQDEIIRYFAEFGQTIPIPLYGVSKVHADTRHSAHSPDYEPHFAASYPIEYAQWQEEMRANGKDPHDYMPVPVHPLNVDYLAREMQEAINAGDIVATNATINTNATISTRTVRPQNSQAPFIKLTMPDIQLTAVARKLSRSAVCVSGPITDLVKHVTTDPALSRDLRIVGEPCGVFYNPDKQRDYKEYSSQDHKASSSITALLRENPETLTTADEIAVPLAGCFYSLGNDPEHHTLGKPLLSDIMHAAGVHDDASAKEYFREYAGIVIRAQLGLFARYGISLEAHQQNTYNVFNRNGHLSCRIAQDLADGAQIYRPVYEMDDERKAVVAKATEGVDPLNYKFNLTNSLNEPLNQFISTTFRANLFPVAALTAKEFGVSKQELLGIMREEITAVLEQTRHDFRPTLPAQTHAAYDQFLEAIEDGLLKKPLLGKAFLLDTVVGNLSGYVARTEQLNPLAQASATR